MGIARLQPMIAEVALRLEERLRALKGQSKVIRLDHAFSAFSGDIIGRICLGSGQSEGDSFLDDPDFAPDWYVPIDCFPVVLYKRIGVLLFPTTY